MITVPQDLLRKLFQGSNSFMQYCSAKYCPELEGHILVTGHVYSTELLTQGVPGSITPGRKIVFPLSTPLHKRNSPL